MSFDLQMIKSLPTRWCCKILNRFFSCSRCFQLILVSYENELAQYITTYTAMLDNTYTLIANYFIY